jgi:UDPglucose 6-dehydrogenase
VKALQHTAQENGMHLRVLEAVELANEAQKRVLLDKITARFGERLDGRCFALWGLAFKPDTDDMREAPSRVLIDGLTRLGARVVAYDPAALHEAQRVFGDQPALRYAPSPMAALEDADALVIVTEWKEFRSPDFEEITRRLRHRVVFDGRNLYEPQMVRAFGLEYHGIGRGTSVP